MAAGKGEAHKAFGAGARSNFTASLDLGSLP